MSVVSGSAVSRPVCAELAPTTNVLAAKCARGEICARQKMRVAKDAHGDPRHALAYKVKRGERNRVKDTRNKKLKKYTTIRSQERD